MTRPLLALLLALSVTTVAFLRAELETRKREITYLRARLLLARNLIDGGR